jgi:hypothetical protein
MIHYAVLHASILRFRRFLKLRMRCAMQQEILDTCTEVSTACSFASTSLERHNHGRDPRGEANGVMGDDSLQTVENAAHLLSSVMQKKQELQSIAAGAFNLGISLTRNMFMQTHMCPWSERHQLHMSTRGVSYQL